MLPTPVQVPRLEEVPPPPRRPSPRARRVVFAYAGTQGPARTAGIAFVVVGVGGWIALGGWIPLLFPAIGAAVLFLTVRANRREIRAFTHGRPVLGRVTFHGVDVSVRLNGRNPFKLRWEFEVPSGEVFEGSLSSLRPADLEPFARGKQVVVLYDPDDPACNTLYVA